MAILPIDLQTLFTQADKAGKSHSLQREGLQVQHALQQIESQKKIEEQIRSVNETQNMDQGASKIKDEEKHKQYRRQGRGREEDGEGSSEEGATGRSSGSDRFSDPKLGRNIDISG